MGYIHRHKTAALFRAAARLGAIAANADARALRALTGYGTNLGLAFQITDDILDNAPRGKGKRNLDKTSCVSVYGLKNARQRADARIREAVAALKELKAHRTRPLIALAKFIGQRMY